MGITMRRITNAEQANETKASTSVGVRGIIFLEEIRRDVKDLSFYYS